MRRASSRGRCLLWLAAALAGLPAGCSRETPGGDPVHLIELLDTARFSDDLTADLRAIEEGGHAFMTSGVWSVADGVARDETISRAGSVTPRVMRPAPAVGDAKVSAEIHLGAGGPGMSAAGLLLRATALSDGLALTVHGSGVLQLTKTRGGSARSLAQASVDVHEGRWHRVAAVMRGGRFTCFFDDRPVLEVEDAGAAPSGGVGLVSEAGAGNSFRRLEVADARRQEVVPLDLPRNPAWLAPLTMEAAGGPVAAAVRDAHPLARQVRIGTDLRWSLVVPPDAEVGVPVSVPAGGVLQADLGTVTWPGESPGAGARLEIAFEPEGLPGTVLLVRQIASGSTLHWQPVRVGLEEFTGRKGLLILRSRSIGRRPGPIAALANPVFATAGPAARRDRPNLLLLVVDTLRADHLSGYGYERRTSPFLDRLGSRAVTFENVIAQSTWTKTSVPSLLTSTHPETHGVRGVDDRLADRDVTLAEVLKENGYFTAAIQTNPWLRPEAGMSQGFMEYVEIPWAGGAAAVNGLALSLMESSRRRPFFLYLHYMDVHDPYTPSGGYQVFGDRPLDLYDGEILELDDQLEGLLGSMGSLGLLDHTVVVITSDHGEEFEEHGGRFHGSTLYREQVAVPWLLSWQGRLPAGRRIASRATSLDVAPTLLDLLGCPIPAAFQGVSLKGEIESARSSGAAERPAFSQVGLNDVAPDKDLLSVTTLRWKYIADRRSSWRRLFDVSTDPEERHDLSSSRPDVAGEMEATLERFAETYRRQGAGEHRRLDPETERRLRSLGYLKQ